MAAEPLVIPESIGPFRVVRPLAQGGMAAVYEVEDSQTGQHLALKLLTHRGLATPRFDREYRALTRLDHPNIVRVYRFGVAEDGSPYLTMELLDGVPAQVHAKAVGWPGEPRRTAEVVRIVAAVADALAYLHDRGIVHRDLKSSNVMVLADGRVKLLDFGTARVLGAADEITRQGEFVGTFAYASPEQLTGGTVDGRSDIYSLGVLFYRLITGKRPFEADNPHALARLHLEHSPRAPNLVVFGIPQRLSDLIMRMLAKDPEDRPPSARAVAESLREGTGRDLSTGDALAELARPRLVGREQELASLRAILRRARPGRMALAIGVVGSGRRRLLEQVVLEARQAHWCVYTGSFAAQSVLGGLDAIGRDLARDLRDASIAVALDEVGASGSLAPSRHAPLFRCLGEALVRRAQRSKHPLAVVLYDLDQASPLALQALRALRQQVRDAQAPVVFFASVAEHVDAPGTPVRRYFHDATRVLLRAQSPAEVGLLVGSMLGRGAAPPVLARRIHEATGGLPGYVEQVVRAMVWQGMVEARRTDENRVEWLDRSGGRVAVPGSVREALDLRIGELSRSATRVIEALAVAGGRASTRVLCEAVELGAAEVRAGIDALVADGLVVADGEDEWRLGLGLTVQVVLDRTRASRKRVLERRLADSLIDQPPSEHKVRLLVRAGRIDRAIEDTVRWAEPLIDDLRAREVLPILEMVVPHASTARGLSPEVRARLYLLHARALALVAPRDERADHALSRARILATSPSLRVEVDLCAAQLCRRRGDGVRERAILKAARDALDPLADPRLCTEVNLNLAASAYFAGDFQDALQAWTEASTSAGDDRAAGRAAMGRGLARLALGRLVDAEQDLTEAIERLTRAGDSSSVWQATGNLADLYRTEARFSEALSHVDRVREQARDAGGSYRYAALVLNLAEVQVEMYRLGEARELLSELEDGSMGDLHPYLTGAIDLVRGRLLVASGEAMHAIRVLDAAVRRARAADLPVLAAQQQSWLGEALSLAGEVGEADRVTAEAIAELSRHGHLPVLGQACACRAQALGDREDPDDTFHPVLAWMDREPARLVRMIYLLASGDYAAARGASRRAFVFYRTARDLLEEIERMLTADDRAAMRVHPWRTRIDRGLYG